MIIYSWSTLQPSLPFSLSPLSFSVSSPSTTAMSSSVQAHALGDRDPTVRVIAVTTCEAAAISGAREQTERLYEAMFERAHHPVERAKMAAERAFVEPQDPLALPPFARTVLVYVDPSSATSSDQVAAITRVVYDGERIVISSIALDYELPLAQLELVSRTLVAASEEIAMSYVRDMMADNKSTATEPSIMIWRGQRGASELLTKLFEERGYSVSLTDRLEMTVFLKDIDASAELIVPDGVEIRALDLERDDLLAVYSVLKMAFGPNPPAFQAWKQHYPQHPRFTADMSFVAWEEGRPVAVSLIELVVDGEGGGEAEVAAVYQSSTQLGVAPADGPEAAAIHFSDDYEARKAKIRAAATTGYVCGVATLPEMRGKRLAQTLLRHNFRAAARAGLETIYLGTDRHNPAAVRAYERAGMVETKSENHGMITAKTVHGIQP